MLLGGAWLFVNNSPSSTVTASQTVRLPRNDILAHAAIARESQPFAQFASPEGTTVIPFNELAAYIVRWANFAGGTSGFPRGQEPSIVVLNDAVSVTFEFRGTGRSGVAVGTIFRW